MSNIGNTLARGNVVLDAANVELVMDTVNDFLVVSGNVAKSYDDGANTLTLSITYTFPAISTSGLLSANAGLTVVGTTTLAATTLGGVVSGGGQQLNNVIIGTVTPLAGAFTTLSSSGLLSANAGLTVVGTTTLAATTLSGVVSGGGQQLNDVIIGTVTPLAGAFTTLSATSTLTTGAPAGGTAAPVKFGVVAAVTPTVPNRTIQIDVSGTIYYLAAKTTND